MAKKTVVGGLVLHEGKLVMVREGEGEIAGKLNFPLGGLEKDESIEAGARREIEEETGLKVRLIKKIGVYHTLRSNGLEVEKHIFYAEPAEGKPQAGEGIRELLFLSLDEFEKIPESEQREKVNRMIVSDFRKNNWFKEGEVREY